MIGQAADKFDVFGPAHVAVMAITVLLPVVLIVWSRSSRSQRVTRAIAWSIAVAIVANEVVYWGHGIVTRGWLFFMEHRLPLHICGLALFLVAWVLIRPRISLFEVAYFWGLAGTLQAVFTPPAVVRNFPDYDFFRFFINHTGIVVAVLFAAWAMGLRPRKGAVLRVFVLTNLWMLFVAGANYMIGGEANYMYLRWRPETANPLLFLPWPWYLVFLEPVALALLALLNLPFWLTRRPDEGC